MVRAFGAVLAFLGLVAMSKDILLDRLPWIAERMPPGEPYGTDRRLHVFNRKASGLFLLVFGLLLLLG